MTKISAVVNVVSEEVDIVKQAIKSLEGFADEVVLIDMTQDNKLSSMYSDGKIKIYPHKLESYVEVARNYGISKARGEWILILDPDEEAPGDLKKNLRGLAANPSADYFRLPRKNIIFDKWIRHSRWWPDYNIRFFKKGSVSWSEVIHSVPVTKGKGYDLEAIEENAIIHHHYQSVEQFLLRLNRYTTALSGMVIDDGYKFVWSDLIHKPANEFFSRYFQGQGYKDGLHGFALSALQAFSEFILYLKVWQSEKFKEVHAEIEEVVDELKTVESDMHYWEADALLREVGGLKHRIKRKLKLG